MSFLMIVISAVGGWFYLLDHQPSMCQARTEFIAKQAPFALEILAARHPLSVGMIRSSLNEEGQFDQFIQARIPSFGSADSSIACAVQTAILHVETDQLRTAIADSIEKSLGIKDAP